MTDREAIEQALAFCAFCWNDVPMNNYAFERLEQTIAVLRDRLERPDSMSACPHGVPHRWLCEICDQSQRKPLTDERCDNLWAAQLVDITDRFSARDFIRDVEAAHGIKEST